jgi:sterol 3beta-glucosyltransferase
MRITIIAVGSRGDTEPCVALGVGLQAAGHHVRIATHDGYESDIRSRGLQFAPVAGDPRPVMQSAEGRAWLDKEHGDLALVRGFGRWADQLMKRRLRDCWRASEDADAVIASPLGLLAGLHISESLRIPLFRAFHTPATPTRAFAAAFVPSAVHLGGTFNLLTHRLGLELVWLIFRSQANDARREVLSLPPLPLHDPFRQMDRQKIPVLYAFSPSVVQVPPDWGDWVHVTGYWFLNRPAGWQPPPDLVDFLDAGPPPVYVGFGSMSSRNPEETASLVVRALTSAGQRGVLLTGWGGLSRGVLSDDIYVVDDVPYDWLFPRVAAAVHHGGAGTAAAALRAGIPSVSIPFMLDQRFWGQRIHDLGTGPRPIPRQRLSDGRLAEAIGVATSDRSMRERAAALGRQVRTEDGVARAVQVFHGHVSRRHIPGGVAGD